MSRWGHGLLLGVALVGSGCTSTTVQRTHDAAVPRATRLSSMKEAMCLHCNCFMPAGIDPEAICPVCNCGKKARECVR